MKASSKLVLSQSPVIDSFVRFLACLWYLSMACGSGMASTHCSGGHDEDDGDDEAVESERLSEDHHEDEGNQNILLSVGAHTSISNNTNSETSSERRKTTAEAGSELLVAESIIIGPFSWLHDHLSLVRDSLHCK